MLKSSNPFALVVLANLYVIQTKQDDPQRLVFKKKLYELAFAANYSEAQSVWLVRFVIDLMLLKPDLEEEFEETRKLITTKNNKNMRTYSKGTHNFIDSLNREYYGSTMNEEREKIRAMIIRCHTQMQMSVKKSQKLQAKRSRRFVKY